MSGEKSALFWNAQAMASLGVVSTLAGDAAAAVKMIGAGISLWRSTGATASVPFFQSYLALAHAMLDQYDESWHNINQAMATIETTGERLWTAEVHRLAGEIALSSPCRDVAEAQARFMRAISVARQQQAKSWELRASISLARLWRDQDKAQQARELLDPVYDWFTEGFDTLDLKDAKELLEKLGGTHRSEAK